jgi:hypothetical protein
MDSSNNSFYGTSRPLAVGNNTCHVYIFSIFKERNEKLKIILEIKEKSILKRSKEIYF